MRDRIFNVPIALPFFILLFLLPIFLLALCALEGFDVGALSEKVLGMPSAIAILAYMAMLFGSIVSVPVYEFKGKAGSEQKYSSFMGEKYGLPSWQGSRCLVMLNVGGFLLPLAVTLYYLLSLPVVELVATSIAVTLIVYLLAKPVRSTGISMPYILIPTLIIAVSAAAILVYGPADGFNGLAKLASAAGYLGIIAGGYILNINKLKRTGATLISIGGAGAFESIFLVFSLSSLAALGAAAP